MSFRPENFFGSRTWEIVCGGGTFINYDCWFDLGDNIYIGDNCSIAMNVHFINSTHEFGSAERRAGNAFSKEISVGSGTWIGADTIVLPGVKIGNGVVISAGSLVISDCDEDNSVYIGRPAHFVKKIE